MVQPIKNFDELIKSLDDVKPEAVLSEYFRLKRTERNGICILVVEDQAMPRQLILEALRSKWNCECVAAKNGLDAIKAYAREAPNLVFLDIVLPDIDGIDILAKISDIDKNSFVVMTTANTSSDDVKRCLQLGAKGYIAKPFTKMKIEQYINVYLEKAKGDQK